MNPKKSIEYSEMSWNPFSGCNNWKVQRSLRRGLPPPCAIVRRYGKTACWAHSRALMLANNPKVKGYSSEDPFEPTFHEDKLTIPLKRKKPTIWATAFMGDICDAKINWLHDILDIIKATPHHTYLMLTKDPEAFTKAGYPTKFPDNVWFGTTVNLQSEVHRIDELREIDCKHRWASFEAPFEKIDCELTGLDFIAIGALTGRTKFQPENEVVDRLIHNARVDGVKVVIKDNLDYVPKVSYIRWEWP